MPYAKPRRVAPSSPLAEYPPGMYDSRDSRAVPRPRHASSGSSDSPEVNEGTPSSGSSDEDDERGKGVKVEAIPDAKGDGCKIDRVPVGHSGDNRRRRRK